MKNPTIAIDADRLWSRLMRLAEIGATPAGGVDRQALTDGEVLAWRQVIAWGAEAGLSAFTDPAANLFLRLAGKNPTLPPLLIGSHLDTQPTGGKFDGVFGVLAALEAVAAIAAAGKVPERNIVVVAWMNEEGSRFAPGMMGSEAFAGQRSIAAIRAAIDGDGISAGAAIDRLHAAFPEIPVGPLGFPVHAYVEPHIEQHVSLEQAGKVIGVVTGIQGKKTFEIEITGEKGHAGTLATADRKDAMAAFARVATALYQRVGGHDPKTKFTIGRVEVEPNAPSVIADRVRFRVDLRHPDNATLDYGGRGIQHLTAVFAEPCTAVVTPLVSAASNEFDANLRAMISAAAARHGFASMPVLSYAGHDARQLAAICPSAMIFIPCRDGVSHDPGEWAEPADVAAGAQVLCDVAMQVAGIVGNQADRPRS